MTELAALRTAVMANDVNQNTYDRLVDFDPLDMDAGFKPSLTRAEVRQDLAQAYAQGDVVQRQHDGQDTQYASGTQSREQVRKEAARAAQTRHAGDVNDLYFGA